MARAATLLDRGQGHPLKVAIVCPYAWDRVGGVQSHIRALSQALTKKDHEVQIMAPSSMTLTHQFGGGGDVKLVGRAVGIPANGSVAPLAFGPLAAAGIRVALRDFEPDVMHLHEPLIPSLSLLALRASKVPSVGTFHAAKDSSVAYQVASPVLRKAAARLSVRTAVSDAARALINEYFPGDYTLTPNGVEVARFADAVPLDLPPGKKVLFVGRLERRKGLETLIQAMTRLRDLDVNLIVAGTGPAERSARALAARLGVQATFVGRLGEDELPRIYRSADVYCAPGLGGESFGIVLVEAMASGTPVICSDLPGYRAVAGNAATLVPPGDAGSLADALRVVLTDQTIAAQLKKDGGRVASMFDWRRLVSNVEAMYEQAIAAPRAS